MNFDGCSEVCHGELSVGKLLRAKLRNVRFDSVQEGFSHEKSNSGVEIFDLTLDLQVGGGW